ncbi:DUF2688 domain-containing protein [Xanthomonas euvesicatoria pv. euvesicatoria]|uniref:DUF2688 domain-containing protein n=2 Tax=Xanthomonas TaxID=338 RepID=A0A6P0FPL7_XANPE|nr:MULTISPECIES: DUF2688 domain-containing protein [Xanthomonas]MBV6843556.1 DUF2688 domain-containing protein [Xanthomonas campestris pv. fici]MBV6856031.1 DUF2688 domain-containing protein [Xanthomonas campestris pv. mirabilis]MBV6898149.1 DUF2688 domain-containing protein [Xanthomonas campestris pv. ionidii]MBZ2604875.1 DUF2688 domain-containing protein [Xanthomonas perforans]MBZ2746632.1 DUF2688 domain-containing protein [Xanthomonas perforans]
MSESIVDIIETQCRRCGTPLRTLRHSPLGLDELKQRLGSICTECMTAEERAQIAQAQIGALHLAAAIRRLQEE